VPQFPDRQGRKLTDFNDLAAHPGGGLHVVRQQIESAIAKAGWGGAAKLGGAGVAPAAALPPTAKSEVGNAWKRRDAVSVMGLDDAVDRYHPIDDGTGEYLFDYWTRRMVKVRQMLALLPPGVRLDDVKRHPTWIGRGAVYLDQVGFDPSEQDQQTKLNTWTGWPMQPKAGGCGLLLELITYLCNEEGRGEEIGAWLLKWMAYPLQNPGAKMASAVIMHGPQGTGKTTVFLTLAKIYGDYSAILDQKALDDKFNADWANKLFVLAEEVVNGSDKWQLKNELKTLVTGEWVRVNPKNLAAYRQRNRMQLAFLSNESQPLPLDNDDRRHLVVYTPPDLGGEFYDELWQELNNGGTEAFYHHLMHLDLEGFHTHSRPPMTAAKQALIDLSKPSDELFFDLWGAGETDYPLIPCTTEQAYRAYDRWCRANGERHPRALKFFANHVSRRKGWSINRHRVYRSEDCLDGMTNAKTFLFPPDQLLQQHGSPKPPDRTEAQWLTACWFRFEKTLEPAP
jgi:putative DNA primase/helicase